MRHGTELGRVRGLGAAKEGTHHWWHQRVTALSNLLLTLWFVISLLRLPSLDYFNVVGWLQQPIVAVPMLLLVASVWYHFRLGVQVMIEDYVGGGARIAAILALNAFTVAGAVAAAYAILRIAFGG
jgi:succinate dehydrogenase / fumarate reductase membrane anchor subunit